MSCRDKSVFLELMVLKKPTPLDELIETIPKPKGAIPNFGLPRWKLMPLESKIPMIPGPEGSYDFTRKKLGKKLWVGSADAEFNLNDPYNYETEWKYEPLHDEHLAKYFSRPVNIRRMLKLGLITKKLDAKCSVRDYNIYRKYLKTLYNDSLNHEIKRRTLLELENRALQVAEKLAEKEVERLRLREKQIEASARLIEKIKLEEAQKLQRQKDRRLKMEKRLKDDELNKMKANELRIQKALEQTRELKKKQETAAFIERQKIVKTVQQWKNSESHRKKSITRRLLQEKERKRKIIEEKWRLRLDLQKKQMEREKFLQQCSHEERLMNIKAYNDKVAKEQARMQKLAEEYKMFVRCYIRRHVAGQRAGTCCIKRKRKDKLDDNNFGNSCTPAPYRVRMDKEKAIDKRKKNSRKKKQKKKRRTKKNITKSALEPEQEPTELCAVPKMPLTSQEPSAFKDKCKCEEVKAQWLRNQKTNDDDNE